MILATSDVRVRLVDMPAQIKGYTVMCPDGTYSIYLNDRLTREQNFLTYCHELEHILRDDFNKAEDASAIERDTHLEI